QITKTEFSSHPQLDLCYTICDLPGNKLNTTPRRFVIKKNSRAGKQAIAFPIIYGDVMTVNLGDSVGTARPKGSCFALWSFNWISEHFAARSLVKTNARIDCPDGFQYASDAERGELTGQHRLLP